MEQLSSEKMIIKGIEGFLIMTNKKILRYNTADRVEYIYSKLMHLGLTKGAIKEVLKADAQCIREILLDCNDVTIHNIGTFKIVYTKPREERDGINPKTLEPIRIEAVPEFNKVLFKPTASLKEELKQSTLGNAVMPDRSRARDDSDAEEANTF